MNNFMSCKFSKLCAAIIATILMTGACGKRAPVYKEKTQQERHESYHRDLTTADLRMFGLKGNVMTLTSGELQLEFMPNGMLSRATLGGDSLTIERNSSGEVVRMVTPQGTDVKALCCEKAKAQKGEAVYY